MSLPRCVDRGDHNFQYLRTEIDPHLGREFYLLCTRCAAVVKTVVA